MLEYTGNDVIYLPKIYGIIKNACDEGLYPTLTINKIKNESSKYLEYSEINLSIKNFNKINIQKDKELEGLLKYLIKNKLILQKRSKKLCIYSVEYRLLWNSYQ